MRLKLALATFALLAAAALAVTDDDPYLWLTDLHGEKVDSWVRTQNARSEAALTSDPFYKSTYDTILRSLDIPGRIPLGNIDHGQVYDFWQDASHTRGLWRRTAVADFAKPAPHWETLLDLDALDAAEHAQYVWQGSDCVKDRCLVFLSPGGGDATTMREFDLKTMSFVEDGFALPLSKLGARFLDADTVLVSTDFGPGSMTTSSYPRIVKLWHRGTPLSDAKTIFEAQPRDISAGIAVYSTASGTIALLTRGVSFFESEHYLLGPNGTTQKLDIPLGADLKGAIGGKLIFSLRADWKRGKQTFRNGALVAYAVSGKHEVTQLYTPGPHAALSDVSVGRDAVYASIFENVTGAVHEFRFGKGRWSDKRLAIPTGGSTTVVSADAYSPAVQFTYESFLTPPTLYATDGKTVRAIKSQAPLFDAKTMVSEQRWVVSSDGVKVPYFLIHRKDAKGPVPAILYSYGGFELSLFPWYWNDGHRPLDAGQAWIAKGGALAVANIRGGGEFGPAWHQAALREHRQRAFDDFAAVARDLIARKVTTPKQLGIVGASNGGVLTTVTMTQHPELLSAVVSQRPLVDMLRYTHFGAGASWASEYGDPDKPEDRAFIEKYSAYELVRKDAHYPSIFFITETSDDRVTPFWARMMAAKMLDQGHDVLFNESAEGGHGPGATNAAQAEMWALTYTFFKQKLGLKY
jgi:prolyl oligopeptidase